MPCESRLVFLHSEPLDIDSLTQVFSGRTIGRRILYHRSLGSTMDEARRLAQEGEPEGTVVIAEEQTSGRGRFDREWISPPDLNLSFSVLLRPTTTQLPYMNMAATLAVADAVAEVAGCSPTIKWPNDVRVDGKKISGILIETSLAAGSLTHAIVGIGLNVNLDPSGHGEIAAIATSLLRETGHEVDRTRVLDLVLERFDGLYSEVRAGRSLTQEWSSRLDTLGKTVQVRWSDRMLEGRAESVDEQGSLVLVQPDGTSITVTAGEVTLQA